MTKSFAQARPVCNLRVYDFTLLTMNLNRQEEGKEEGEEREEGQKEEAASRRQDFRLERYGEKKTLLVEQHA